MVRFYRYGLTIMFVACCALGLALGTALGPGGGVLGVAMGAMAAACIAALLDTDEKTENAVYGLLSVAFLVALVWLGATFVGLG